MTNASYAIRPSISTMGSTLVRSGLLSSLFLGCPSALGLPKEELQTRGFEFRDISCTQSAANHFYFLDSGTQKVDPMVLERAVSDFYSRLHAEQETLGAEFEKVLVENLWDLYSRS